LQEVLVVFVVNLAPIHAFLGILVQLHKSSVLEKKRGGA
jgi:hypothetical protein